LDPDRDVDPDGDLDVDFPDALAPGLVEAAVVTVMASLFDDDFRAAGLFPLGVDALLPDGDEAFLRVLDSAM
jgi:hypothetical protein